MGAELRQAACIVGPPGSGGAVLAASLSRAAGVWHLTGRGDPFASLLPGSESDRSYESHQLTAADAEGREDVATQALLDRLRDREDRQRENGQLVERAVIWSLRSALRVPFLARALPSCRFVLCVREPAASAEEMLRSWRSGSFVSEPNLPGWRGLPWSLPLISGWRELAGQPLERIVVEQWTALAKQALGDLEALDPGRWAICDWAALVENPRAELRRLCEFLDVPYDQALLSPVEQARRELELNPPQIPEELRGLLGPAVEMYQRIQELRAAPPVSNRHSRAMPDRSPFRSVFTGGFPHLLSALPGPLLVSTYQSGRLICVRERDGMLNTHLRSFDKPMGIACTRGRFALGTRTELWDFRDFPAAAPRVEPAGTHDACFLPLNRHATGDILVHELAYDGAGTLWGTATAFSCLVTFDLDSSFVPRWRPPFVSELAPGDRCHLNGICLIDGRLTYATALGQSDEPGGWRPGKATGGCLIDIASGEIVAAGLSMPHSPRWHDGRLWVLESGRGELVELDPETGTAETVAELPGFTRGLALHGHTAFVGLSQIRESSTFGDLPLTERLQERVCGVWAVDLRSGETTGLLRFDDLIQEIFDVAILPGPRYPEIAEPGSTAVAASFALGRPQT